jgi:hypothetical protein
MAGGSTEELQKRALCVQRDKKHFERLHQQSKGDLEREQRAADFAKWEEVMKRRETNTSKQEKQRLDREAARAEREASRAERECAHEEGLAIHKKTSK